MINAVAPTATQLAVKLRKEYLSALDDQQIESVTHFGPLTEMTVARMLLSMGPTLTVLEQPSPTAGCDKRPATALATQHLVQPRHPPLL